MRRKAILFEVAKDGLWFIVGDDGVAGSGGCDTVVVVVDVDRMNGREGIYSWFFFKCCKMVAMEFN